MRNRVVWLFIGFAALAIGAAVFLREPPVDRERARAAVTVTPAPTPSPARPTLPPPPAPTTQSVPAQPDLMLAQPLATKTGPFAIEDGKTIDFSTGMPLVKETAKDKAIMDRAAKELEEAVRGVTFGSPTAAPAPTAGGK